jgi:hypothetical protein
VAASAAYLGLDANPVVRGKVDDSFLTDSVTGAFTGPHLTADGFGQDALTVLAGRLPRADSTDEIALSPSIARLFRIGVGGHATYQLYGQDPRTSQSYPTRRATFLVTAIVDIPPVLTDQADQHEGGVLPPGATRRLLTANEFAWVGVRLDHGTAGIPALQRELGALASRLERQVFQQTQLKLSGLAFNTNRADVTRSQVQQAIRPQAVALAVLGAVLLALAGAIAASPLAPVGPAREFDPARGVPADGLVLGGGSILLAAGLLGGAAKVRPKGAVG